MFHFSIKYQADCMKVKCFAPFHPNCVKGQTKRPKTGFKATALELVNMKEVSKCLSLWSQGVV